MKTNSIIKVQLRRSLLAMILITLVGFATVGCGEVVSIEGIGDGTNNLMLSWDAPETNEDGTDLEDLAGYKLYYGTQPGQYTQVVNVGDFTTAEIGQLASGTYYVAVTAYDVYGNESDFSDEIHHTFL